MKTIGKYKICGLLGRGGMSKVFKVELPVIGKVAALKLLEPHSTLIRLIGKEKIHRLFVSEATAMSNLKHPNIVEVWDFDENNGAPFYTMDYFPNNLGVMIGETYQPDIPSRIIPLDKAVHYTRQILSGLACLHHYGIIHRDIKPYNILVTEQDLAKIGDFGLSKLRGEAFKGPPNLKVGSPWYAAPEQEDDPDTVDYRADLYAVGVILYRMVTGTLPGKRPKKPSTMNTDLDDGWDFFLKKTLSPKPQKRYSGAKEMIRDLNDLYKAWTEKKAYECNLPFLHTNGSKSNSPIGKPSIKKLRTCKVKANAKQARQRFGLDPLWRPVHYVVNDFETGPEGTVVDSATGLVWQQSGCDYPLTWGKAAGYIATLNKHHHAGRRNWRLPTIDELISILTETPHGQDLCIEPIFDQQQKWLWSCDKRSYTSAWYVSVDMGFVSSQDLSAYYYVRGVSDK